MALLFATDGALLGNPLDLTTVSGGSKEKGKRSDWKGMLLCRECVEVAKEDETSTNIEDEEKERSDYTKIETREIRRSGSCDYVDNLNGKRCQRVTFRHLNYCYTHKLE